MHHSLINFFENTPSIYIISFDLQDKFTYCNTMFKKQFTSSATNKNIENFLDVIHEESVNLYQETKQKCITDASTIVKVELKKKLANNIHNYIQWNFFAIANADNVVNEIGAIGYDITENNNEKEGHKTTIQKLHAVLNSSDESFYFLDKEMKVLSYNLGAKKASSLLYNINLQEGYDFRNSLLPGTEENFCTMFKNALNGMESEMENEQIFPTGKNIWYKLIMKPVLNDSNIVIGVAVNFINIDKIKKSEQILNEIAWQQSHYDRKPVSNILGLVNLLKNEKDSKKSKELLDMLDASTKELDEVIKNIIVKTL